MDKLFLQRLLRAKIAFRYGILQLESELEIQNSLALIMFDNSIEIMAAAVLDFKRPNLKTTKNTEPSMIELVKDAVKVINDVAEGIVLNDKDATNVSAIVGLHKLRNQAQHHGLIPSKTETEYYREATEGFLQLASKRVFNLDWNMISLGILIKDDTVRKLYTSAEDDYYEHNFLTCIIKCGAAFQIARLNEEFRLYGSMRTLDDIGLKLVRSELDDSVGVLADVVEKLAWEIDVLKLGLDYKKFLIFREMFSFQMDEWYPTPTTTYPKISYEVDKVFREAELKFYSLFKTMPESQLAEDAKFCLLFIIEPILKWETTPRTTWIDLISSILESAFKTFSSHESINTNEKS
jgi:hypothetical protein